MNRRELLATAAAAGAAASTTFIPGTSAEALEKDFPLDLPDVNVMDGRAFYDALVDWRSDQILEGRCDELIVTRETFKHMIARNMAYEVRDGNDRSLGYQYERHTIRVPGTALA